MSRTSLKCLLVGVVLAVAIAAVAPQANAQCCGYARPVAWSSCYAPRYVPACYSCYSPCYATVGCCGSYYASDWYLGVRPGPVRRLLLGPYRWYGAGWGYGYGCGCGVSYGYDYSPCCSDDPSAGTLSVPGAVTTPGQTPTPAKKPTPDAPGAPTTAPAPMADPGIPPALPSPPPTKTSSLSFENSGVLTVWVPYDAKVTINGRVTKSIGSRRQFVSYGLTQGLSYKYVVKAELVRDGQTVEDTRTVTLTAGQTSAVAFGFNVTPAEQVAAAK
jgi:uncharacterized protein (TIGR03000 family)